MSVVTAPMVADSEKAVAAMTEAEAQGAAEAEMALLVARAAVR